MKKPTIKEAVKRHCQRCSEEVADDGSAIIFCSTHCKHMFAKRTPPEALQPHQHGSTISDRELTEWGAIERAGEAHAYFDERVKTGRWSAQYIVTFLSREALEMRRLLRVFLSRHDENSKDDLVVRTATLLGFNLEPSQPLFPKWPSRTDRTQESSCLENSGAGYVTSHVSVSEGDTTSTTVTPNEAVVDAMGRREGEHLPDGNFPADSNPCVAGVVMKVQRNEKDVMSRPSEGDRHLASVSGALCDAGTIPVYDNDIGKSVRLLTAERDAYRTALQETQPWWEAFVGDQPACGRAKDLLETKDVK